MRTRKALVGLAAGTLLVLGAVSLGRADFLGITWPWSFGNAPKQPEGLPKAGAVVVSDVAVQGSRLVSAGTVLAQIKTRPGAVFSLPVLEKDVQALRDSRQFANVAYDLHEDGPGRVKVRLLVRDMSQNIEKVTYVGALHLTEKELEAITGIRVGVPVNPDLNRLACRRIVARYNESGRPFATCTLLKGGGPTGTEVLFSITEGPQVVVRDVRFDGNNFLSGALLAGRVRSAAALRGGGGKYDPDLAEADASELQKYYRTYGYDHVKVSRELRWDEGARSVSLVFHIDEGVRFRVPDAPAPPATAAVEAPGAFRLASQENALPPATAKEPPPAQELPPAKEMPPAKIGKIHVAGNKVTPSALIIQQSGLVPGGVLTLAGLRKAEAELAKIKLFEVDAAADVQPTVTVLDSESDVKDLLINVKEKDPK